jgi:hypothetical protein
MQTQGSQQGGVSAGCTGCEHAGSREYAAVLRGARAAKHEPTLTGSSVHRVGGGDNMGSGGGGGAVRGGGGGVPSPQTKTAKHPRRGCFGPRGF